MPRELTNTSPAQDQILSIMEDSSFNEFHGKAVADSLREHRDLWLAAYFGPDSGDDVELILRDLPSFGIYHASTLFLLPAPGKEEDLSDLAASWGADEIGPYTFPGYNGKSTEMKVAPQSFGPELTVLRVWWD